MRHFQGSKNYATCRFYSAALMFICYFENLLYKTHLAFWTALNCFSTHETDVQFFLSFLLKIFLLYNLMVGSNES